MVTFYNSDTLNLHSVFTKKDIKHGFIFNIDNSFEEVCGRFCGLDRENYKGSWSIKKNKLIQVMENRLTLL